MQDSDEELKKVIGHSVSRQQVKFEVEFNHDSSNRHWIHYKTALKLKEQGFIISYLEHVQDKDHHRWTHAWNCRLEMPIGQVSRT